MTSPSVEKTAGFGVFNLDPALNKALSKAGYDEPRPIQVETIAPVIEGRDVLGLAQTGTGKTAAFGLPLLQRLLKNPGPGPRALILAPTRELAIQIDKEIRTLAHGTRIRTVTVYGGVSDRAQIQTLRKRPEIVVGCPGRVLDLLQRGEVKTQKIDTLVLDEADHMFDMGFLPDIRRIISKLPEKRQNLLFAATMPRDLRKLTGQILVDPMVAELAHSKPAETIEHGLYPVQQKRKLDLLEHLLKDPAFFSSIVFTRTKHRANRLALQLKNRGLKAVSIQGNMTQGARDRAMKGFRDCRFDVLVATDIVARGIDVEQVSHVINYDVPNTAEAYTHRIGRTGRSEREGRAYTFVAEDDLLAIEDIEIKLGITIERCTIDGFEGMQIPLPTRRQRQTARKSSSRSHSRGQQNSRAAPRRHDNRKSSGSNFESRKSHKPRHDNRKSGDSNFDSKKSYKPRHDNRKSGDSNFDSKKSYTPKHDSRKSGDSNFDSKKSHKPRHDSRKSGDSNFDSKKSYKPRHDNRKSGDSNFDSRKSRKPRPDSRKSGDSNFDSRKSRKPRRDSEKSTNPESTSHRSAGARARARDAENLPFKFKWMEDIEKRSVSNESSPPRRKRSTHGPSGEDTPAKKSKSHSKRRRRRNKHRSSDANTAN